MGQVIGGAAKTYLADIATLDHAWTLFKYSRTDSGTVIRVRRASDNGEADFGFGAGDKVDTAGIASFASGGYAYVTTLHDRIGTSDLTCSTAANQPAICDVSGNVLEDALHNAELLYLGSANDYLSANGLARPEPETLVWVCKDTYTGTGALNIIDVTKAGEWNVHRIGCDDAASFLRIRTYPSSALLLNDNTARNNRIIGFAVCNAANSILRINGHEHTGATNSYISTGIVVGTNANVDNYAGRFSCLFHKAGAIDSTEKENMEAWLNDQYEAF